MLKILCASITSKTLFIKVAESTDILYPIFQFGCLIASLGFIFLKFIIGRFKNGPPDAVINIFSIFFLLFSFNKDQIEKCSESTGINSVLYFFKFF